ncbi:MAG: cyanophycin synthetase [Acutalibacteraceae bacterium]
MGDCTKNPLIIIDGAHNQDGIDMLKASVKQYLPNRTIVAVIGALRDKDTDYMVHALADVFHHVITITPNNPRALDAKTFALRWIACGRQATAAEDIEDAMSRAEQLIGENGVILVCGSLFVAAEAREKIKYHFMEK